MIKDTLPLHEVTGVWDTIEAARVTLLFRPPSPNFNTMQAAASEVKALLRAKVLQILKDLWRNVDAALSRFRPEDR